MKHINFIADSEYLESKLAQTYKLYSPFDEVRPVEEYLEGVKTAHDKNGVPFYETSIKLDPLRIVVKNLETGDERVAWQMIGTYKLDLAA